MAYGGGVGGGGSVMFECEEGAVGGQEVEGIYLNCRNLGSAEPRSYGNVQEYTERDLGVF